MKKVVFNPYAKTKTTTSNDCDKYDDFCTVLSDIEAVSYTHLTLPTTAYV